VIRYYPKIRHRKAIRLQCYDYSQEGAYFVTLCAHDQCHLFGEIQNQQMILNDFGYIVKEEWQISSTIRKEIEIDEFIIMANHIHGIVIIKNHVGAHGRAPLREKALDRVLENDWAHNGASENEWAHSRAPLRRKPKSLGSFIAGFKSLTTSRINSIRNSPGIPVWQRNYYEHIIRDDFDLCRIREYIQNNPLIWDNDDYFSNGKND